MIENYMKDQNGVIHQINKQTFSYNVNYIKNSYCSTEMKHATELMSNLRLGYIAGLVCDANESILDVGYGNGAFLKAAQKYFKRCGGYDVVDNTFLPEGVTRENSITSNYYDVITFFDSLEHCDDLNFVKDLCCSYVVVSVPWCHYISDSWFTQWKHRKPNEHLHHFNNISLTNFMDEMGFSYINSSNIEDVIRTPVDNLPNILTATFVKR